MKEKRVKKERVIKNREMQSKGNVRAINCFTFLSLQREELKRAGASQKIGFFYKAKSLGAKLEHACSAAFRTPSYVTTPIFEEVQVFVPLNGHKGPTLLLQKVAPYLEHTCVRSCNWPFV
ncbi:hypothetical protein VIGAN_08085000 [Vigna angularis var. angularis]|uniref:Uncharacterized protein n=1 Tax=Vigna angularis var. angularis TaxID=157739 RepID=A0A0S3SN87_PHAAN|nr:hypothetical protein VIGAN_08085000 [Vigna angularis var. angularis]